MKFGKNLQHLSIPEWKCYNIDYNDLKNKIRQVTLDDKTSDLQLLYQLFVENFDYVNLFVTTKLGEMNRKLKYLGQVFVVTENNATETRQLLYDIDEIFTQSIELSIILKNLSKFIIIQKIALKKLFKKLLKYYSDTKVSSKFIVSLKNNLVNNPSSFINIDLLILTTELTEFITTIKSTQTNLLQDIHLKRSITDRGSISTLSGTPTNHVLFDLNVALKKNFHLDFLLPNESNNLSDLVLNLNVYLNLNTNSNASLLSFIYLTSESSTQKFPSYIISNKADTTSTLVVHTGGLRNYTHCTLSNKFISILLKFLMHPNYEAEFVTLLKSLKPSIKTETALQTIFTEKLKPTLRSFCKRSRFILKHNDETVIDDSESDAFSRSPLSEASSTNASYQDDFFITLDYDIFTTDRKSLVSSLNFDLGDFSRVELFPHNHLTFHSNDSNLSNFIGSLETEVKETYVTSKYDLSLLRLLPQKLQDLISNNNVVSLYKDLSFYQYMQSCYLNIIPDVSNNHYSKILELNLLKNYECIERFNNQLNLEHSLIKAKSQHILKRQLSLRSLTHHSELEPPQPSLVKQNSTVSVVSTKYSLHSALSNQAEEESVIPNDLLNFGTDSNDDDYLALYINMQRKYDDSVLSGFALTMLQFQKRLRKRIRALFGIAKERRQDPEEFLLPYPQSGYDSIYEESPKFLDRNSMTHIHNQYERDYNQTLSYIYFSLNLISIFLSGLELGIIYSIFRNLESSDSKLLINENVWLILILVIGMLLSLVFSMTSISLIFLRYTTAPFFHTLLIWGGFAIVCLCCMSSMAILLQGM